VKDEDKKRRWKTLSGVPIPSIEEWVKKATAEGQHLHIGTDSLQTQRWTQFVTVVVVLNPPKGGTVAYCRTIVPRIEKLRERLVKEVWHSTELSVGLAPLVNSDLTIHIDANPDEKHMSSKYLQELTGMVVGQGFKALYKPDSWAATHAADHVVRSAGKLPRGFKVA
jgi:predicted RNase H-related nuclease YkuK (DUF458 family)